MKKNKKQDWVSKHLHNEETRERNGANICEMRLKARERSTGVKEEKEEKEEKGSKMMKECLGAFFPFPISPPFSTQ